MSGSLPSYPANQRNADFRSRILRPIRTADMTHFSTGCKSISTCPTSSLTSLSDGFVGTPAAAPDWLYADLLLYYLRHFVEERTFCEE